MKYFVFWMSFMIALASGCLVIADMVFNILSDRGVLSLDTDGVAMSYALLWFIGSASVCYAIGEGQ